LYLQENLIETIENLESQVLLDTINLSQNYIKKIENLGHMKELKTLLLAKNRVKTLDDVAGVLDVPSLTVLDVQDNLIDDAGILQIVESMPNLTVLYLKGNPCVKEIKHYRKTIIARCPKLKYLDDRPVFDDERLRSEAFINALSMTQVSFCDLKINLLSRHSRIFSYPFL
jgi:dynein assembly factor 1